MMLVRTTTKAVLRLLFDPEPAEDLQILGTTSLLSYQGLLPAPTLRIHSRGGSSAKFPSGVRDTTCPSCPPPTRTADSLRDS